MGISIDFILTTTGAGGLLLGVYHGKSPAKIREEAINRGGRFGFYVGLGIYLISLLTQLSSNL